MWPACCSPAQSHANGNSPCVWHSARVVAGWCASVSLRARCWGFSEVRSAYSSQGLASVRSWCSGQAVCRVPMKSDSIGTCCCSPWPLPCPALLSLARRLPCVPQRTNSNRPSVPERGPSLEPHIVSTLVSSLSEIALAVVLLVAAGILGRTVLRLSSLDAGINTRNVVTAHVALTPGVLQSPAQMRAAWQDVLDRARRVPGVRTAALSDIIPMRVGQNGLGYWTTPAPPPL